jgi:hypothetical protein
MNQGLLVSMVLQEVQEEAVRQIAVLQLQVALVLQVKEIMEALALLVVQITMAEAVAVQEQ